jgi:hypothetical protein
MQFSFTHQIPRSQHGSSETANLLIYSVSLAKPAERVGCSRYGDIHPEAAIQLDSAGIKLRFVCARCSYPRDYAFSKGTRRCARVGHFGPDKI